MKRILKILQKKLYKNVLTKQFNSDKIKHVADDRILKNLEMSY